MKSTSARGYLGRLDARIKIISFFMIAVISGTTPAKAYPTFAGYFGLLVLISLTSGLKLTHIIKRVALALPFMLVLVISLPFFGQSGDQVAGRIFGLPMYSEGLSTLFTAGAKATLAILAISILTVSTPFDRLMEGFKGLGAPKVFLATVSFMQRYVHVLSDEAQRMKRARDSRNFNPRWIWQTKTIGNMIGVIFLRSYERGERVYISMLARGYDGKEKPFEAAPLSPIDLIFVTTLPSLAIAIRFFAKA
ncbi:MAG: cobalt ECF transporter T component CbiQ [Actinomycetota bacterium]|nr:cobalt ECF transporter T component CbiQ [Actinomycetota bacterium]